MEFFTERGRDDHEIIDRLTSKYGHNYRIISRNEVRLNSFWGLFSRRGWEYYCFIKPEDKKTDKKIPAKATNLLLDPEKRDSKIQEELVERFGNNTVVRELAESLKKRELEESLNKEPDRLGTEQDQSLKQVQNSSTALSSNQQQLLSIKLELDKIGRKIDLGARNSQELPNLTKIRNILYDNEFTPRFVEKLFQELKREFSFDLLGNEDLVWEEIILKLMARIKTYESKPNMINEKRIFVLVGPTGVGKTTTIAKLAARGSIAAIGGKDKVHLITLDNYRIGAQQQIKTYGEILQAQVDCVETYEDLKNCVENDGDSDLILIDTTGRNPNDFLKLAEMRKMLDACGNCEIHLAISATSSAGVVADIITQFTPFKFQAITLTKTDEAAKIGGALSAILEEDCAISFMTNGQKVPQDIKVANPLQLLKLLKGIKIDFDALGQNLAEN